MHPKKLWRILMNKRWPCRKSAHGFFLFSMISILILSYVSGLSTPQKPYLAFGIFIGKIEEGARIFTPARLLPLEHPEAFGHDFPTVLRFHQKEYEILLFLGEKVGLKLKATLQRYPRQPVAEWEYPNFKIPPAEEIKSAEIKRLDPAKSPIPGLRVVAFQDGGPICFIVDTRDLTLKARGMKRSTAMGLDVTRQQFLEGLNEINSWFPAYDSLVVIFQPK